MYNLTTTKVFSKNLEAYNKGFKIIANKGSARSSKSWSIMQLLVLIAISNARAKKRIVISIVGMTLPQIKSGVLRDFQEMLGSSFDNLGKFNKTELTYKIGTATIEFFSADKEAKVKGPARDILWLNEANHIPYPIYKQLSIRTRGAIFLDYNPASSFWFEKNVLNREKGVRLIHSTYKDNNYLDQSIVNELESYKPIFDNNGILVSGDIDFWRVYGLGLTGGRDGLCIRSYKIVDRIPDNIILRRLGMDFGFNDPTTLIDVCICPVKFEYQRGEEKVTGYRNEIFLDELLYRRSMTSSDTINSLHNEFEYLRHLLICADQARPDTIEEIKRTGINIKGVGKGDQSILIGLDILNRYPINITRRSTNIKFEMDNYKWKVDKNGESLNIPDKSMHVDHAIDAIRYVALEDLGIKQLNRGINVYT